MKSYLKYISLFIILVLVGILAINLYSSNKYNLDTTKSITFKKSTSSKSNTSTVIKKEDNSSNDISNEESSNDTSYLNEENTSNDNTDSKEDTDDTDITNNIDNNSNIVTRSSVVTYEYNNSEVISDNSSQNSNEEDFVIEVDNSSNTNQVSTKEPSTNNNQSNTTSSNNITASTDSNSTQSNSITSNNANTHRETTKKESTLSTAKTYNKVTILGSINSKNLTNKVTVVGDTSGRAQSFCVVGTNFITAQINNDDNRTLIQVYDKSTGKKKNSIVKNFNHSNGMTYNKNTNLIYVANMNGGKISTFSSTNLSTVKDLSISSKTFSKSISSIAYDNSTNQYYFGAGNNVYISDSNFNLIRTIKKLRKGTPQDIGAYNGIIFVIVYKPDNTVMNAVDLYRASDGGYLGTFNININYELESIDYYGSGNIFSLYFNTSGSTDYIYNTSIDLSQIK